MRLLLTSRILSSSLVSAINSLLNQADVVDSFSDSPWAQATRQSLARVCVPAPPCSSDLEASRFSFGAKRNISDFGAAEVQLYIVDSQGGACLSLDSFELDVSQMGNYFACITSKAATFVQTLLNDAKRAVQVG